MMTSAVPAFGPGEHFITIDELGDARLWKVSSKGLTKIISNGEHAVPSSPPSSYSVREVAELLHVTQRTIFARIHRGELGSYKSGGARRVTHADLEAWRAEH